jgi:hypothetical protein
MYDMKASKKSSSASKGKSAGKMAGTKKKAPASKKKMMK